MAGADAEHVSHRHQYFGGAPNVDIGSKASRARRCLIKQQRHDLSALGCFEGPEGPTEQDKDRVKLGRFQRRQPTIHDTEQVGIMHQDGAGAGEESLDECSASCWWRSARQRLSQPLLDIARGPRAAVVQQPGRSALHQAVPRTGSRQLCKHVGEGLISRRM